MYLKGCWVAAALVLLNGAVLADTLRVYVSPTGKDDGPGTSSRPFRTLERARDAVRQSRLGGDAVIELAAGEYILERPLVLGPEDSGRRNAPVTYRAAEDAVVVVSGGAHVTGWVLDADGRYRAPAPPGDFRQLYINGRRAQRARGPVPAGLEPWGSTTGAVSTAAAGEVLGTLRVTGDSGYRLPDAVMAGWANPSDLEFGYYNYWSHKIARVSRIVRDGDGAIIVMDQPGYYLSTNGPGAPAGAPAYIENALELLDEPGEWYLDRVQRMLYYLPRPGEDMASADVVAPQLETLVRLEGTPEDPVHDVVFEGIAFAYATWLQPSRSGHPDVQANFTLGTDRVFERPEFEYGWVAIHGEFPKSPANVVVRAGHSVRFSRCAFAHLGGAGLDIEHGSQRNTVDRCLFTDISGSGIQIGDVQRDDHHPEDSRLVVLGNTVRNCEITRIGAEYEDSIGIFCGYVRDTTLEHNEIADLPYSGISVGWGWGETDAGGVAHANPWTYETPTPCGGNRVLANHIHHVMLNRTDGGAIYTLGNQPGTVLRGNYIHDNGPGVPGGVYLDQGSGFIEVANNVIVGVARAVNYNNYAQGRNATCNEHDNWTTLLRYTAGVRGQALAAGGSSHIEAPHADALEPETITVEAWIKPHRIPTGEDARRWIVCKTANEFADGNYSLLIDGANVSAYVNVGGGQGNSFEAHGDQSPVVVDEWQQVAMTYDGRLLSVYRNGKLLGSTEVGRARTRGAGPLAIGARQDGFTVFDGDIDNVRVYSRALTEAEIASDYSALGPDGHGEPVAAGLASWWDFDGELAGPEVGAVRVMREAGLSVAPHWGLPLPF